MVAPLIHKNPEKKSDEELANEAAAYVAGHPEVQVLVKHFENLRARNLPYWHPKMLREANPAAKRFEMFAQRPDIRARVVGAATGLVHDMARDLDPADQAKLVDKAIAKKVWDDTKYEHAFSVNELFIYGVAPVYWEIYRGTTDFVVDSPDNRGIKCGFIEACMNTERRHSATGKPMPFLTHLDVVENIDGADWHTRLSQEMRIEIDRARYKQERESPNRAYTAKQVMEIVTLKIMEEKFAADMLVQVENTCAKNLGLSIEPKADPLDALKMAFGDDKADDTEGDKPTTPPPSTSNDGPNAPPEIEVTATETKSAKKPPPVPSRSRVPEMKDAKEDEIERVFDGLEAPLAPKG